MKKQQLFIFAVFGLCLIGLASCEPAAEISETNVTRSTRIPVQTLTWGKEAMGGKQLASEHYRIYTTVNGALLKTLPGFLEAAYDNYLVITQLRDAELPAKMPVYMMATRNQWAALSDSKFGMRNSPAVVIDTGGYSYRGINVCWNIGGIATYSVASHEGMHQFLYHRLKNKLPLWAEEGLSTTAEGFVIGRGTVTFTPDKNLTRMANLRHAIINGLWISLELLLTTDTKQMAARGQNQVLGYYGQLYALTSFLRGSTTYGPGWYKMFRDAQRGQLKKRRQPRTRNLRRATRYPGVFAHYITTDFATFEKEYLRYTRKMVHLPAE